MSKQRRHPLAKETFLEGNRQRWAAIFTAIGLLVMVATSYGWLKDPAPFLQFFLSIGVTFILGASATAVMNSWKTSSTATTTDVEETVNRKEQVSEEKNSSEATTQVMRLERPRDYDSNEIE